MFLGAFRLRQVFYLGILDFTHVNKMGFIHPHTVTVGFIAIHYAVGGITTKRVPSSAHDKILRHIYIGAIINVSTYFCQT
jgi:hypothetical protein